MTGGDKSHVTLIEALKGLYRHLSLRRKRQVLLLLMLMLMGSVAELLTLGAVIPFIALMSDPGRALEYPLLQQLFALAGWQKEADILLPTTLLFVVLALMAAGIRLLLSYCNIRFAFGIAYDFGVEVYRRTLYQPYKFHVSRNTSEIIAGSNKVQVVASRAIMPLAQGVSSLIISIFIIAGLFLIDPVVAMVAAVTLAVAYTGISIIFRRRLRKNSGIIAKTHSQRVQAIQEGLGGIRDVLIDSTQPLYVKRFRLFDAALRAAQATNNFIGAAPRYVLEAIGLAVIAFLAYFMSLRAEGVGGALPVLGAFALGAQRLLPSLQTVYASWTKLVGNERVIMDVLLLMERSIAQEYQVSSSASDLPFEREISLCGVNFRYAPDATDVIRDMTFSIPKGHRVGIAGKTGSGKSTLMDLVMGLLEPTRGEITIDGKPLTPACRRAWQAHIAHVPQSIFLSDATIAENIAFGVSAERIDYERVYKAARKAQVEDFILRQPHGYQSVVGERGVRISGGQRQRIGIARALYKRADVLVLDEATSALDSGTEEKVMQAINGLDRDLTVIVIAHRVSTLSVCDFVVEMSDGKVTRRGSYKEFVSKVYIEE